MPLLNKNISIDTAFNSTGEEGEHISLIVGDMQDGPCRLSLAQARSLATALIQQVHRIEVRNSMKKMQQMQTPSSLERSAATICVPASHQA